MYKALSFAALLAITAAQDVQNLTAALTGNANLSNLTTFVSAYPDLLNQLASAQNITILAPTDEAFSALNSAVNLTALNETDPGAIPALLSYHVLNGAFNSSQIGESSLFLSTLLTNSPAYTNVTGGQVVEAVNMGGNVSFISGLGMSSLVSTADIVFTGGVIHVIDSVLTLPETVSETALANNLTYAYGALGTANLVEAVDTAQDVTVFVPANAAFEAIGSALGDISAEALGSILSYHVVPGTIGYSTDLQDGQTLDTLVEGQSLTINIENGTVFVNGASVIVPNVLVANGVVHVIDQVLNPEAASATPTPGATVGVPAFSASSGSVPFTTNIPTPTVSAGSGAGGVSSSAASQSSSTAAAVPMQTGAIGAAALFGAGAAILLGN